MRSNQSSSFLASFRIEVGQLYTSIGWESDSELSINIRHQRGSGRYGRGSIRGSVEALTIEKKN
jgi:hypothetical protein